jgi:hypothetical protein
VLLDRKDSDGETEAKLTRPINKSRRVKANTICNHLFTSTIENAMYKVESSQKVVNKGPNKTIFIIQQTRILPHHYWISNPPLPPISRAEQHGIRYQII